MKPVCDLKKGLIFGDIITDKEKETFYRFLHYNNEELFKPAQCEKLEKVKCGEHDFILVSTHEEITLSRFETNMLYLY